MFFLRKIIIILLLLITLIYVSSISNIPDSVLLFKEEALNLKTALGIIISEQENNTVQASVSVNQESPIEKKVYQVSFFNIFNIKEIEVNKIEQAEVIPLGNTIGLKLYTNGVLVIGMTEIEGEKPYINSNIKEGDLIIEVNSKHVETTSDLIESVNESEGEKMELKYLRDGVELATNIQPVQTKDKKYKIGLWVRDGAVRSWDNYLL